MRSVDEQIEEYQKWYLSILVKYEPILTEYCIIPIAYDSIFHVQKNAHLRNILICLIILKRLWVTPLPYIFYILIPILSYASINDIHMKAIVYSCVYSHNMYESAFIGINTTIISSYYPLQYSYIFHIMYIAIKNNFSLEYIPINDKNTSLEIRFNPKKHRDFKERLSENLEAIELYINTFFEQMNQSI